VAGKWPVVMTQLLTRNEQVSSIRNALVTIGVVLSAVAGGACSSSGSSPGGTGGATGSGGAAGSGGATAKGSGGQSAGAGGHGGGGVTYVNAAVCGERGMAKATTTTYAGTAQFYIIGNAGLDADDACTVQFDVKRVDAAPTGCTDCSWTHLVEYSNPMVMHNTGGACDASDSVPALDAAGQTQLTGSRIGRGFSLLAGHGDQIMKYDEVMKKWNAVGRSSWNGTSTDFGYDIRTGACNYGH
jgi:hypothetical protein